MKIALVEGTEPVLRRAATLANISIAETLVIRSASDPALLRWCTANPEDTLMIPASLILDPLRDSLSSHGGVGIAVDRRIDPSTRFRGAIVLATVEPAALLRRTCPAADLFLGLRGSGFFDLVSGEFTIPPPLTDAEWNVARESYRDESVRRIWNDISVLRHATRNAIAAALTNLGPVQSDACDDEDRQIARSRLAGGAAAPALLHYTSSAHRLLAPMALDESFRASLDAIGKIAAEVSDATRKAALGGDDELASIALTIERALDLALEKIDSIRQAVQP